MIILDERQHLFPQLVSRGFEVFDFFENCKVLSLKEFISLDLKRRGDFLLIDTETVLMHPELQESFKAMLNTFLGSVFFHEHSQKRALTWVEQEGAFLTKIIGEYSLPMPQLQWTILSNQLQFFWNLLEDQRKLQKQMAQFSLELDQVLQNAEEEMHRARKVHESLVPRRSEEIKGIHFSNKYAAGKGGGGEFYDLLSTTSKVYQILVSSQSYLISSALMGILGHHKSKGFKALEFIEDAWTEIRTINSAKKKKAEVDLLVTELDLNHLTLTLLSETKSELYSQTRGRLHLAKGVACQLERGEKVIVFSQGFLFNWRVGRSGKSMNDFLKEHEEKSSNQLMSELFFQLKNSRAENFLQHDATLVMMEVNRHGIHKV
jgi:hypothetical protein